ncbi:39S ribosomal protein L30, mitochondrial [Ceratina calcarata]|uniref:39S ribosomal protein L30, mitochondrial n=1 Tax=Ceratina calcarata TaxID=156304 RepID=A0AAJ7J768_9HYME|nr:39S ribosomal protein L30, mitochondrial [Ceratina calcarata]
MASCSNVLLTITRGHKNYTKTWLKDAVRYEKVKYHPRTPDHVDPPFTPSKVLMIVRVKPFKGNPWWNKIILKKYGLKEEGREPAFVKNTPEACAELWTIKHLIKIVPLKLPEKLPEIDDMTEYYVHEDGSIHVTGKLDPVRYKATQDYLTSPKRMAMADISEKLRLLWLKGGLI